MKVKNIAFTGFAAAILAAGAAHAATVPQIASKQYVDDKVENDVQTLQTTIERDYTKTEQLGTVINQNITNAMTATDGAIKTELDKKANAEDVDAALANKQDALTEAQMGAVNSGITTANVTQITTNKTDIAALQSGKEDTANKKTSITDANKESTTDFPTIGAVVSYTSAEIEKLSTDGLPVNPNNITDGTIPGAKLEDGTISDVQLKDGAVTTPKIADKAVTAAKLSDELNTKIDGAQTADQVTAAIASSISDTDGAINTALAGKANADDVYTKEAADAKFDTKIPVPSEACQAASGRCVLSVVQGSDGKTGLSWIDVTAPLEGGATPAPAAN